ncbi:MAG: 16S rRNA (guanine(527)-N(7))-methyltransferase RsmG [Chitinophagaceae bacterium]
MEIILKYFDDFTVQQKKHFEQLGPLYRDWNAKINVVSRKEIDLLYQNHVLHSLSIATVFEFQAGTRVLDIGTGGGFPGIPLAIFFPEVEFVLVDSIKKKLTVVNDVIEQLQLKNVTTFWGRVEDYPEKKSFDMVVSRAVTSLGNLWHWANPFLKKGVQGEYKNGLICLKGGDLHEEISLSNTRPSLWAIKDLFEEPYFNEKYIVYVPKN